MKPFATVALVVVSAGLYACSSAFCSNALNYDAVAKFGNCDGGGVVPQRFVCKSTTKCDTAFVACSTAEQGLLNQYLTCINAVPTCVAGSEASFSAANLACAATYFNVGSDGGIGTVCGAGISAAFASAYGLPDGGC